jgi:hypothetical protein
LRDPILWHVGENSIQQFVELDRTAGDQRENLFTQTFLALVIANKRRITRRDLRPSYLIDEIDDF